MDDKEKYHRAKNRVEELKGFYSHLISFIVVNVILAIINLLTSPQFLWFLFITLFWGIGLAIHAFNTFSRGSFLGKKWEEEKLKQFMEEEDE